MCSKALLKGVFILPFPYCRRKKNRYFRCGG
nr:MAG TPA: hypothetical protein [Caudoviricetes sp.]